MVSVERGAATMPYAPPRGTRPGNRKELIQRAGAELFYQYGFANVSMSQIAQAVSIGPSALYRHFAGKQELLIAVVAASVHQVREALADVDSEAVDSAEWYDALVRMSLDTRAAGVLWQRDARYLPSAEQNKLRTAIREIRLGMRSSIEMHHPESQSWSNLLTSVVLSICLSLSYHHVSLPRPQFEALMKEMIVAALDAAGALPSVAAAPVTAREPRVAKNTAEKLVAAAAELFAQKGFAQTGLEEIASAVGISEPSIYHHFPSKLDLLFEVLQHGNDALQHGRMIAMAQPGSAAELLNRLLTSYLEMVSREPALFTLLVTELGNLAEQQQAVAVAQQRTYLNQWVELLLLTHPLMAREEARIRVHAVTTVLNDFFTRKRQQLLTEEREMMLAVCQRLLQIAA
ncbi:TetR/AcrR family transcriptional regulator [Psychromicrobium lacuslunae]|uniref:HTH tetR-type domain-containing protein n=1 Tax=Psychromicrobium lacuslunae TaxID=1618207 RepID=A0A0D4C018_9MICC|nr:TetR/AcrR family transcriptional regulator [Psychromicrobium lacuslunae]AJT41696.1 hypothetical protein UM93_09550 [Psychromicrobium lacuslunae]